MIPKPGVGCPAASRAPKGADTEGDREQTVQKEQRIDERAAFSYAGQPS